MHLKNLEEDIIKGKQISKDDAKFLACISGAEILELFSSANIIKKHFRGDAVDLCSIINAKSGGCTEDCAYCAQSSRSSADAPAFSLIGKQDVIDKASEAKKGGARRFCIVTSGRRVSREELKKIANMISSVRKIGLLPCATLGLLDNNELAALKEAGLERYHNNLETSEEYFPKICGTHTYQDKIETIQQAKAVGLSVCSGGIFGLGESWKDRIDMAFSLRGLGPDSIPINFLTPIKGTLLEHIKPIEPMEALKIISIFRFILPDKEIRVCGGRLPTLGEFNSFIFFAGADGLLVGNYLTTPGRDYINDLELIRNCGLRTVS